MDLHTLKGYEIPALVALVLKSDDKSCKKKGQKCDNVKGNTSVVFSDTYIPLRLNKLWWS
jgi:hypothetical protein